MSRFRRGPNYAETSPLRPICGKCEASERNPRAADKLEPLTEFSLVRNARQRSPEACHLLVFWNLWNFCTRDRAIFATVGPNAQQNSRDTI
jgi:hypothetical protein